MSAAPDRTTTYPDSPADPGGRCPADQLGALFDPLGAHSQDPYPFYAIARRDEPVFYSPQLGMWCVTRHDDIVAILRDPKTFASKDSTSRPWGYPPEVTRIVAERWPLQALIFMDPPEHTRVRQLTAQGFAPARIAALEPMIREVADDLIDRMGAGPADIVSSSRTGCR